MAVFAYCLFYKANHCIGVLTAKEVIGTRRINLAMQQRNLDRTEITADMIMTPWQKLSAMPFEQLNSLTIEDLVLSMERFTEQHLLITEHKQNQPLSVRGIISATDIQHAMGNKTAMQVTSSAVPTASKLRRYLQSDYRGRSIVSKTNWPSLPLAFTKTPLIN